MKVYFKKKNDSIWIISGVSKGKRWIPGERVLTPNCTKLTMGKIKEIFPKMSYNTKNPHNYSAYTEFYFEDMSDDSFFNIWSSDGIEI
jgi:hypothetical protein